MAEKQLTDPKTASNKEKLLEQLLSSYRTVLIAFSGGADSTYLLSTAVRALGAENVLAVTLSSPLHPAAEAVEAEQIAEMIGAEQLTLPLDLLQCTGVSENKADRCYHCKSAIFKELISLAGKRGLRVTADGTNADDAGSHRPGLRALKELGVRSPLLEAALGKEEIRLLSKRGGLQTWDKPATPCLATRFPTGDLLTASRLKMASEAEEYLRRLEVKGNLRVRVHGHAARIEADPAEIDLLIGQRVLVVEKFKQIGFKYVSLDLEGFRSGSMDK